MNNPWRPPPDPDAIPRALLGVANQRARCERGEHDATEARKGYATYVGPPGRKRQLEPGTRYCRFCSAILPREEAAKAAGERGSDAR